jgi:peptide alpha-N-acetyltransferase
MLHYRWVKDSVKNKNKLIFVSRNRLNRPVGFILFKSENGKAIVELVAIEKEYRKRGIGTLLINKVINYARKTNNKTIFVSTQVTNKKAIKLYKKAGFVHDRSVYTLRYYKNEK